MSYVTNVILSFSVLEEDFDDDGPPILMRSINEWLQQRGHVPFGRDASGEAGGEKYLEVHVYVAAFNYLHHEDFLSMLQTLPWRDPVNVQVFLLSEDDDKFTVMEPCRDQRPALALSEPHG